MQNKYMIFLPPRGAAPWAHAKFMFLLLYIYIYIRRSTQAYIRCNIDAYIRGPHTHAYIECLAVAAGNNGDCNVVSGTALLQQQCLSTSMNCYFVSKRLLCTSARRWASRISRATLITLSWMRTCLFFTSRHLCIRMEQDQLCWCRARNSIGPLHQQIYTWSLC